MKIQVEFAPGDAEKTVLDSIHERQSLLGESPLEAVNHEDVYRAGLISLCNTLTDALNKIHLVKLELAQLRTSPESGSS